MHITIYILNSLINYSVYAKSSTVKGILKLLSTNIIVPVLPISNFIFLKWSVYLKFDEYIFSICLYFDSDKISKVL